MMTKSEAACNQMQSFGNLVVRRQIVGVATVDCFSKTLFTDWVV